MSRSVILIGLPGAGKTTVGRLVAEQLKAPFIDADVVIQRKMSMPVSMVFAEHGESKFRQMESDVVQQALEGPAGVIVPGGGWAAQPEVLEQALPKALVVYLKAMVTTAAKRLEGQETRPLLGGQDPLQKMRELLKEREPYYNRAHAEVKVDGRTPEAITRDVVQLARTRAGW
jgi:shikimate kinase